MSGFSSNGDRGSHATQIDPGAGRSRGGRNTMSVLSLLTALWLAAQFGIAYQGSNNLYPVTNYAMFASGGDWPEVRFQLAGVGDDGTSIDIEPEELALTRLQLNSHLVNHVGRSTDRLADDPEAELEAIAGIWTERHGIELVELALWRLEYWPGAAGEPLRDEVARWEP